VLDSILTFFGIVGVGTFNLPKKVFLFNPFRL